MGQANPTPAPFSFSCVDLFFRTPKLREISRISKSAKRLALILAFLASTCLAAIFQTDSLGGISLPTDMRIHDRGWWPTKGEPSRNEYVGDASCAKCHAEKSTTYANAAMAHAAAPAADSAGLRRYNHLSSRVGPFSYEILTTTQGGLLSVADANSSVSQPLTWAFGEAHMGQTYVYEKNGSLFESHLSYFTSLNALDVTPGQNPSVPSNLEDAAGRRMDPHEAQLCFGCHTTASTASNQFDSGKSIPGVGCENCHGPGAAHVAAMQLQTAGAPPTGIFNPSRLGPVDSVDFCGACHRTWQDVVKNRLVGVGVFNVRFAPYRLENSRCWGTGDARLTCTACHDPHQRLVSDPVHYDAVCLQCHVARGAKQTAKRPGAACPVAAAKCVTCHMPQYEPPGLHSKFADHWIRIVKPGSPYPS